MHAYCIRMSKKTNLKPFLNFQLKVVNVIKEIFLFVQTKSKGSRKLKKLCHTVEVTPRFSGIIFLLHMIPQYNYIILKLRNFYCILHTYLVKSRKLSVGLPSMKMNVNFSVGFCSL